MNTYNHTQRFKLGLPHTAIRRAVYVLMIFMFAATALSADCYFTTTVIKNGAVEVSGETIPVYKLKGQVKVSSCEGGGSTLYYAAPRQKAAEISERLKSFYLEKSIFGKQITGFETDEHGFETFKTCDEQGDGAVLSIGPMDRGKGVQLFIKKGCD